MKSVIDPEQPLPIYAQLKTQLLERILAGEFEDGRRLPTEHELSAELSISRTPVHRALAELAAEGVILRQRRHGSFVNPHWLAGNRGVQELRVMVPDGPWEDLVRAACPPGVSLNVATVAIEELHQSLTHAVAEGRAPDVALFDSVWVTEFATSGFLYPLDELDPEWLATSYSADAVEPFLSSNRHGGHLVALQAEADVAGLWYRRDPLEEIGAEPPRTWATLLDVGRQLVDAGHRHPLVVPSGSRGGETTTYCLLAMLAANGAALIEGGQVAIDTEGTRECLQLFADLVAYDVLSTESVLYDFDRGPRRLADGSAALLISGSYELRTIAAHSQCDVAEVWGDIGFTAPPRGPGAGQVATLAGGMVHGILRQAANPHLAMALLRGLAEPAAVAEMSRRTGQLATLRSAADMVATESEFLRITAGLLAAATVRPGASTYPRVSSQLQQMVESVVVGRLDPAVAAYEAAERISAITGLPVAGH